MQMRNESSSLKCIKYSSSSFESTASTNNCMYHERNITSMWSSCERWLIDAPSLKEMHMHKINVLLCAASKCEVARCVKDPLDGSTYKYHSFFFAVARLSRIVWIAMRGSRSTCDVNFPVPKKAKWSDVLACDSLRLSSTHTHSPVAGFNSFYI